MNVKSPLGSRLKTWFPSQYCCGTIGRWSLGAGKWHWVKTSLPQSLLPVSNIRGAGESQLQVPATMKLLPSWLLFLMDSITSECASKSTLPSTQTFELGSSVLAQWWEKKSAHGPTLFSGDLISFNKQRAYFQIKYSVVAGKQELGGGERHFSIQCITL